MFAPRQMTELQQRKRLLVLEADLHRAMLCAGVANVRERLDWLQAAREQARSAGPWLGLGAAALGLLVAWRGRKLARWIPTALAAWASIQKLRSQSS